MGICLKCHPHLGTRLTNDGLLFSSQISISSNTKFEKTNKLKTRSNLTVPFIPHGQKKLILKISLIYMGQKQPNESIICQPCPKMWMTFFCDPRTYELYDCPLARRSARDCTKRRRG